MQRADGEAVACAIDPATTLVPRADHGKGGAAATEADSRDDGTKDRPNTHGQLVMLRWAYADDMAGNQITHTSFLGNVSTFGHDQNGHHVIQRLPDGQAQAWSYTPYQQARPAISTTMTATPAMAYLIGDRILGQGGCGDGRPECELGRGIRRRVRQWSASGGDLLRYREL